VVVTFNETVQGGAVVGVTTFTGVDETTPISAATSGTSTSAAPSVSVVSASNELVFAVEANLDNVTATPGGGQSVLWDLAQSTGADAAASIKNGAALTSMSYTLSASKAWAMGVVSITPISITGISTISFTQNPVLCDELIIKSGDPI